MRIIGGVHKRKRINPPANISVRPTTDIAKESLFNVFNNYFDFEDLSVLDLFAGTGSISYEFASRGAKEVYAIEIDDKCVQFIRNQAKTLPFPNLNVVRDDAHHFLTICTQKFDIIFADPPFDHKKINDIHKLVFEKDLLNDDGWLVMEHGPDVNLDQLDGFFDKRKYGKVNFSIFSKHN